MAAEAQEIDVYIALGSNLGDRAAHIQGALAQLEASDQVRILRCSRLHETPPVGGPPNQGPYLNAVALLHTQLSPHALLSLLQEVERRHGRQRGSERNTPRTLDLDVLLFGDRTIATPELCVPHPRMWEREFVLAPLRDICDAATLDRLKRIGQR